MKKRVAAIIPARAGSKGVKNKNIRLLNGKPLIEYTLDAALSTTSIDQIVVSTNFEPVMDIVDRHPNVSLYRRPEGLATDTATRDDVFIDAVEYLRKKHGEFNYYIYLQPTSPLRVSEDIENALSIAIERDALSVVSVCECDHTPLWSNVLPENHSLENFISREILIKNRQELPTYYRLNGAIYLVEGRMAASGCIDLFGPRSLAYIMPRERSIDIDTEVDLLFTELIISRTI